MLEKPKRKKYGGRQKGSLNKSKDEIKELLDANVDFSIVVGKLNELAMGVAIAKKIDGKEIVYREKPDAYAMKILLEYRYGKPQQSIQHSGEIITEKHTIKLPDGSKIEI